MLDKRKDSYGPIASGLMHHASYITYADDFSDTYDGYVYYHNKPPNLPTEKPVAWWMNDATRPSSVGSGKCDVIFLCNKEHTKGYERKFGAPVHYLPQTGIPFVYREYSFKLPEIVFIGRTSHNEHYTNRTPIIYYLKKFFDVELIDYERYTIPTPYIYRNTPISLAISPQYRAYTSNRLYNILSCKGFCLTLWFPEIENLFTNHKHLVWFKTKEEAAELARYYIDNPDKRDKIAEEGYKEYMRHHTPQHRWRYMESVVRSMV